MPILKAGVLYFVLVFGAGFVPGTIRTLWIVPRLGTRMAELMETPIMLVITMLAARWTVRRLAVPSTPPARLCPPLGDATGWLRTFAISPHPFRGSGPVFAFRHALLSYIVVVAD
jgi:hypothetical protein